MKPDISAILCTHNQAHYLKKSLMSLISQSLPRKRYEIIVVDNASRDRTKEIILDLRSCLNLRYVYEPKLGLSQARNRGWQEASGNYAAYLDDDAVARTDWLSRILQRFKSLHTSPAAVGGRIKPIWETGRPQWLVPQLSPFVGIIDWSSEPMYLNDTNLYLAGSNMAFSMSALKEINGFSPRLGRQGGKLLSSEEILLQRQLMKRDMPVFYDPGIAVSHHLKPACISKSWFKRRLFWQGASDAILEHQLAESSGESWRYLPILRQNISDLITACRIYALKKTKRSRDTFAARSRIYEVWGHLVFSSRILLNRY